MRKQIEKIKRLFIATTLGQCLVYLSGAMNVYALEQTKLVTGTKALINDALVVLLAIEAGLVVFLLVKEIMALQAAAEEEKPKHKKQIKVIIVTGVLAISATGILTAIFSYYQRPTGVEVA